MYKITYLIKPEKEIII